MTGPRVRRTQLEISVDGERVFVAPGGRTRTTTRRRIAQHVGSARTRSTSGCDAACRSRPARTTVGVAFLSRTARSRPKPLRAASRATTTCQDMTRLPHIDDVVDPGPFDATGLGDTPSRRRIFVCRPDGAARRGTAARRDDPLDAGAARLSPAGHRRRPRRRCSASTRRAARAATSSRHRAGAARCILASPEFLFRSRARPARRRARRDLSRQRPRARVAAVVLPVEQHSRRRAADAGRAAASCRIRPCSTRRCAACSPTRASTALVEQFRRPVAVPAQPAERRSPTRSEFPDFDDNLRQAFRTRPSCSSRASCARTAACSICSTADYTFVNERLARHYGIPNVYGSQFRRVTRRRTQTRRGLLGQGSILTVTSYPNRTSPVLRGKWILENILGTPPPAPPPNVPALKENDDGREAAVGARAHGAASREPGVRELSRA